LELEHSEKQEVLRDIHNRVSREDLETLDRGFEVFHKEKIAKVLTAELASGIERVFILTTSNFVYVYQFHAAAVSSAKQTLIIEQLCVNSLDKALDLSKKGFHIKLVN
jgi:hypothetical protein